MSYFRLVIFAGVLLLLSGAASAQQDIINNFAGGGPNDVPATSAPAVYPTNVVFDSSGNMYYSAQTTNEFRVFKVTPSGTLTVFAGSGPGGYAGDGGLATEAQLYYPQGIAIDSQGNLFIADEYNHIIREVNASTGNISTVAGQHGQAGYTSDGIPATTSDLYYPSGVAIDTNGNLIIADQYNYRIREVACVTKTSTGGACTPNAGQTAGDIYTIAGTATACSPSTAACGDGGAATSANFYLPYSVAIDNAGNVYIGDTYDHRIRRVACGTGISGCAAPSGETAGDIYTIAGDGTAGYTGGDGIAATSAELYYPLGVTIDSEGNLLIADQDNYRIREVACVTKTSTGGTCVAPTGDTIGDIYTVAGNGTPGYGADGVPATGASGKIYSPYGVAVDNSGNLLIADYNNWRVRLVACGSGISSCTPPSGDTSGDIYTVAGNGTNAFFGEGVPATGAIMNDPVGTASDSSGNIYIADRNNCVVREVNAITGIITTFAGKAGMCGYTGDGGAATSATLYYPNHLTVDSANNVYITDRDGYCVVRKVSGGTISTIAGKGTCGTTLGDGGPATSAELYAPSGVAVDSSGNVYIADYYNYRIRKVSGGTITTFAGNGTAGFSGDGGPATSAEIYNPNDVAVDAAGNVYIDDYNNWRIRKVDTTGKITTFAGNGASGFQGDGGPAIETSLYYPYSVAVDSAGDVLISDYSNERIRLVDGAGNIHTVAGNGTYGFLGYGVLATTAEIAEAQGVGTDPAGNIYVSDSNNDLVRQVSALAELNSSPSSLAFDTQLTGTTSPAVTLTLNSAGPLTISSITPSANFSELDDCPGALSNGATCTVDVYFSPTSAGIINGTLTIADNAFFNSPLVVNLRGTATDLTIAPNPLQFGQQTDGTPVTDTVTVTGNTTYAATSATLSGDADYSIASNTCIGHITTSCAIGIKFSPTLGAHNATLAIHDSDPTSAQLVPITGTGCSACGPLETFTPNMITFPVQTIKSTSKGTKVTFSYSGAGTLTINKPVATAGFKLSTTGVASPCSLTATTPVTSATPCNFNVEFSPTVTGTTNGTVKVTFPPDANSNTSITMNVSGTGTNVKLSKNPLAFGTVASGTKSETLTITNEGTANLTFSGTTITGTGNGQFAVLGTSTCPTANLAHLGTCTYIVQFTHAADSNSFSVNLNITDSDPESPTVVVMTAKD